MALLIGSLFLLHVTFILLFLRRQWTCGNSLYRVYTVVGCPLIIMQYASHALASMLILLEARLRKTEYEFATSRRRNGRPIIDLTMATFEFPLGIACLRSRSVNDRSFVNALNRANNRENRERIDIASRYLSKYLSISSKMETRFLSLKKKKKRFVRANHSVKVLDSLSREEKIYPS